MSANSTGRMPVWFIGHGSPMNALEDNNFTRTLRSLGKSLAHKPCAILVISSHWLTRGTYVSTAESPDIMYDFFGFPEKLYRVTYPVSGSPEMANQVLKLMPKSEEDPRRELDHGAWSFLIHLYPNADIPVFQLSVDFHQPLQKYVVMGNLIKSLRDKGVLVIGSGNIVHNLQLAYTRPHMGPYRWALEFDEWIWKKIQEKDIDSLVNYQKFGNQSELAVPTPDHYIPMLYCAGFIEKSSVFKQIYAEVFSSISMRCFSIE